MFYPVFLHETDAQNDRHIRTNLVQPPERLVSIQKRHVEGEKNEIVSARLVTEEIEAFEARLRSDDGVTRIRKDSLDQHQDHCFVIHDKDAGRRTGGGGL